MFELHYQRQHREGQTDSPLIVIKHGRCSFGNTNIAIWLVLHVMPLTCMSTIIHPLNKLTIIMHRQNGIQNTFTYKYALNAHMMYILCQLQMPCHIFILSPHPDFIFICVSQQCLVEYFLLWLALLKQNLFQIDRKLVQNNSGESSYDFFIINLNKPQNCWQIHVATQVQREVTYMYMVTTCSDGTKKRCKRLKWPSQPLIKIQYGSCNSLLLSSPNHKWHPLHYIKV